MRRFLTYLTAFTLLTVSLAIGVFTADLPFWRRVIDLPLKPNERYLPVETIGDAAIVPPSDTNDDPVPGLTARVRDAGADSLLVMRRGRLVFESYIGPGGPSALRPADFIARPLAAIAVGAAVGDGRIRSIDEPVSKYLPEWEGEPRGKITLRELLDETSGLARGVEPARLLGARPFEHAASLPSFATSRGVRLVIGNDYESTALDFPLEHEPGGFFNESPVNAQLVAVIVERASGIHYVDFVGRHLVLPQGAFNAEFSLDRRSGMPAAHCCMRARARDVVALGELLRKDGMSTGTRILPAGWVAEMLKGSRANPDFGLQLRRANRGGDEIWFAGGEHGGMLWIVPARELTVALLAPRDRDVRWNLLDEIIGAESK